MVPRREAFEGSTFDTRKTSSRRPAMAAAGKRLGLAGAVHLRGIDMGHAEVETLRKASTASRGDCSAFHVP